MMNDDYDLIFKIILIGDSGVGKTNILSQYIKQKFYQDSKATVGVEFGSKIVEIDGKKIKAQIWDTAGQERYKAITSTYYRGSKGAFIVYDVTRPSSFENVDRWISEIKKSADKKISLIIVGNKIDLKDNIHVTKEMGGRKAKDLNICFIETSALDYNSVDKAFEMMIKNIYNQLKAKSLKDNNDINDHDGFQMDKGNNLDFLNKSKNNNKNKNCDC